MGTASAFALLALLGIAAGADDNDRRVDVGGFELRAQVFGQDSFGLEGGQGRTAVVFDAGGGDGLETWKEIPAAIAEKAPVVVYDRAGLGESDLAPTPRSARRVAEELHALLEGLGVAPPYVLVGHSVGGLHIRVYADLYSEDVAGMVFVDVTTEGMHRSLGTEDGWRQYEDQLKDYPAGVQAESRALWTKHQELEKIGPPPDVPAVVISSTAKPHVPESHREEMAKYGLTEERLRELLELKLALHAQLAAKFPRGWHVRAERSHHYVHHDEPGLVTREILAVVRLIRNDSGEAYRK